MSARAAALAVATIGAGAAAWWYLSRQRAAALGIVADNFGFLDDGSGIYAPEGTAAPASSGTWGEMFSGAADAVAGAIDGALMAVGFGLSGRWLQQIQRPENAQLYQALLSAEMTQQIPSHMLVRLAYQESRYNPQAYNAGSGASGIMQIVPRWHPGVDPFDPYAAIPYAAKYLDSLYRQFGNWENALRAYNWGATNLKNHLATGKPSLPRETSEYSRMILADAGRAAGYV